MSEVPVCVRMIHSHRGMKNCWNFIAMMRKQNGRDFADDILKCTFSTETVCILIRISLTFVSREPIDNKSTLVQIRALCRTDDKQSEQITKIYATLVLSGVMGKHNPSLGFYLKHKASATAI